MSSYTAPPPHKRTPPMSDAPARIQRSRAKGSRLPPNTVSVTRPGKFGNLSACARPHHCGEDYCCLKQYREFVTSGLENRSSIHGTLNVLIDAGAGYPYRTRLVKHLPELRGKNLACWCSLCDAHKSGKPLGVHCPDCTPCHADILLEIANSATPHQRTPK